MVGKIIGNKYGLLILGIIALGVGIFLMSQTEVKCGSNVMKPGDICTTIRKGVSTDRTFDEQKSSNELTAKIVTGVGGAMTLGGAGWIIVSLTRRKPAPETVSA
ncbi:MAG TPA: hypothetical protein VFC19_48370 [Candidatus Limnocylindrales bacterium]|nr:hypothetical protein [Candidatus Limnocylindrales bacterium]